MSSPSSPDERKIARQHLRLLASVSTKLANCMTVDDVVQTFVTEAHEAADALSTFLYFRENPSDDAVQLTAVRGVAPKILSHYQRVALDTDLPVAQAMRAQKPCWVTDHESLVREFPSLDYQGGSAQALMVVPVIVDGAVVGAVAFSFCDAKLWEIDEREFFVTLVAQFVAALERARLLRLERDAHQELERSSNAIRLMADVGTLLSSSLDYEAVLSKLTEVLVPAIADWCAVDVLNEEGRIQRLAAFHSDPAKIAFVHAIEQRYPGDPNAKHGVANVLRTGQTEWMADIPDAVLVAGAKSEEHLELVRSLGLRSYIAVPLQARGRILGVLSLVMAESGRRYTQQDVTFVEELAKRASLSVDNAKLYTQQTSAHEALADQTRHALLVGDVGTALTRSKNLRETLERSAEAVVRHLGVACARLWTLNAESRVLELQASAGGNPIDAASARIPVGHSTIGHIAASGSVHVTDALSDEPDCNVEGSEGLASFAGFPLIVDERVVGVLALYSHERLPERILSSLAPITDAIAVGIERQRAEARARAERDTLEVVNQVGQALAAELDQETLVQAVTDYSTRLCGAAFGAFFYNVVGPGGESYTLYTISGVPREAFSKFPMPRNTQVFAPTFNGECIVRVDDITKDPRYGHNAPRSGMPVGHLPVKSYLAVPVISRSGNVIGGLFFGHPQPAMFTDRHEAVIAGVAAQAATAMDNARLFKEAQHLITQLDRSNRELDEFAYVASHDLKAPLRGIASVTEWLEEDLESILTETARHHFNLMRNRVTRMEGLINGILDYSRAGKVRTKVEAVVLSSLLSEVVELLSPDAKATIDVACDGIELCTERVPLQQVLMNLLGNALKHAKHPDLRVHVKAEPRGDFVRVSVTDNGPGIAPRFHERVWGIFQTLQPRDSVEGTGIGLSVVKKLVEAKGGSVQLHSDEGAGATFVFTWPLSERSE